jgi:DNA-binding SARP family transcriptional activator
VVHDRHELAAPGTRAQVRIFGEFRIETPNGTPLLLSNRRGMLLIALLCLQSDHSLDRETLCQLLWPDRFHAQAKASLRQCLLDLRHQFENEGCGHLLIVTRSAVALDRALLRSDLATLEQALAQGDAQQAIATLEGVANGPLLQAITFNSEFDDWLALKRQEVDARLRQAAARLLSDLRAVGEAATSARLGTALQARYPVNRSLADIALAVLPFGQTDQVGGDFFLAEGVTDELVSRLGKLEGIMLAGRTSVLAVAARGQTLTEMAASLRVTHLIEGEVRRTPDLITVRLALIEGATGTEIWADRITGSIDDFFESRKPIGSNIIAAICRVLGLPLAPAPMRRMTANREAYALYLQGRSLMRRSITDGAAAKALELLEEALALDPDFAECWTALADAHVHNAVYTPCLDRVERSKKAAECARRAVALDPGQGHALAIQGIHEWTRKNPAGALDLAFEAYAREPRNADVALRLGSFLLYIGRTRAALPFIAAGVEQDPAYGRNYAMLSTAYFNLGEIEPALAAGQRMIDLGMPGMWLSVIEAAIGEHDKAVATYFAQRMLMNTVILPPAGTEPMNDAVRDVYWQIAAKGVCSGDPGARMAYCAMLDGLHQTMPDPCDPSIAFPAIWMGHGELVMTLYRACLHPANMFGLMSLWADVEPIRQIRLHPGFMGFAEDIGLVEAWERHGWPDLLPKGPHGV